MEIDDFDLDIALRTLNQLAYEEGDLGYAYWNKVIQLLKQAANMQDEIDRLSRELDACRASKCT